MAIKGVPIDFSKKYKTVDGKKITKIESHNSITYPVIAYFIDEAGTECPYTYTEDGFFKSTKVPHEMNLVLDEAVDEEWPKHAKKRKVVQIAVKNESDSYFAELFALTDDGNIYSAKLMSSYEPWEKLPPIPQD